MSGDVVAERSTGSYPSTRTLGIEFFGSLSKNLHSDLCFFPADRAGALPHGKFYGVPRFGLRLAYRA